MGKKVKLRHTFSKRLVVAYASIIIIPLSIFFSLLITYLTKKQKTELYNQCIKNVDDNYQTIAENIDIFNRLEQMIESNNDLMLFLMTSDHCNEQDLIITTNNEVTTLERILSVMPSIYSVRIFTDAEHVPERWPILLNTRRTHVQDLQEWEYNYKADYMGFQDGLKNLSICMTRPIKNKRPSGYIQVSMKMESFFPFLYNISSEYQNDYLFKINREGDFGLEQITNGAISEIQAPLDDYSLEVIREVIQSKELTENTAIQKECYKINSIVTWRYIRELDAVIVHTCSTKGIGQEVAFISLSLIALFFITGAVLFIIIKSTTSRLMKSVYTVMDGMNELAGGNMDISLEENRKDEVGDAQKAFNVMAEQLRTQIQQIKQEQELIAETEMKAMQNQINAHFLYNVLETIRMQAILSDQDEIAESISILGKMMRYCLRWRIHTVTIDQEIEYISSYIYILNIRNDYAITLINDIDSKYYNHRIPKMFIQPFVENSFTHAIEPTGQDSSIRIFVEESYIDDRKILYLCIQDYGPGIEESKLQSINLYLNNLSYEKESTGGIGIKNIQQRLVMFYGENFKLQIISKEGSGTIIKVPVPFEQDNE